MKSICTDENQSYDSALRFLYNRINYERVVDRPYTKQHYKLARMRQLLGELGNPHLACPVIHIAGTKGKGSVAWLIAQSLEQAGYRTGLYTSPHLRCLEERFVLQGTACSRKELIKAVQEITPVAKQLSEDGHGECTFFELTTAIGWLLFAKDKTDAAVVEVGLGGRLDSTNVCNPILSIITSISFDHQQQLGNTLAAIAGEKAGIIKPNVPVISGATAPEAAAVIQSIAANSDSELIQLDRDFHVEMKTADPPSSGSRIRFHASTSGFDIARQPPDGYALRLLGPHQARNAAVAIAAMLKLNNLGWHIPESAMSASLANTQVPARIQIRSRDPWVILDTAHNEASMQALIESLDLHFPAYRRTILFSSSKDKNYRAMLQMLLENFDDVVLTQYQSNPRAVLLDTLTTCANEMVHSYDGQSKLAHIQAESDPIKAWKFAKSMARPQDMIVIAGSFFLAAELMEFV